MRPVSYAAAIILIFSFTALTFLLFDYTVALQQSKIVAKAKHTHAIVSSLFPSHMRDQLLQDAEQDEEQQQHKPLFLSSKNHLKDCLGVTDGNLPSGLGSKPIAELYPITTVLVSDWCLCTVG
jgi:hypothetical protein